MQNNWKLLSTQLILTNMIFLLLTIIACALIHFGNLFYDKGKRQLGILLFLIGSFQLLGEFIALF